MLESFETFYNVKLDISKRLESAFKVMPKRRKVECTFSWLSHSRRLSKDYEIRTVYAETMVIISHLHTLLSLAYCLRTAAEHNRNFFLCIIWMFCYICFQLLRVYFLESSVRGLYNNHLFPHIVLLIYVPFDMLLQKIDID